MYQKGFSLLGLLIIIVFASAILILVVGKIIRPQSDHGVSFTNNAFFQNSSITPSYQPQVYSPAPVRYWVLKKDKNLKIYEVRENEDPQIARWGEWLVFKKVIENKNTLQGFNIKTGEKKTLFEDDSYAGLNIYSLSVINEKLLFATGGYLQKGSIYIVFSIQASPKKIATLMSPGILKESDGTYFIHSGFGDSCAGSDDIYLLDANNAQIQLVVKTEYSCGQGTYQIGYDSQNGILVAESIKRSDSVTEGWVTQVLAYPIQKGNQKVIISNSQMPKETKAVRYDSANKKILLLSESAIFEYDLVSQSLKEVIPLNGGYSLHGLKNNRLCLIRNDEYFEVSLAAKQINKVTSSCIQSESTEEKIKNVVSELNLPADFTFELE